jgi:hypothetical protein
MTPLEISILLHYHSRADDFREGDFSAPAVRQAIDWFRGSAEMLIQGTEPTNGKTYKLTERGEVFVDALLKLPLPVRQRAWVMPQEAEDKKP